MEISPDVKRYNKLAIIGFVWLSIVLVSFIVLTATYLLYAPDGSCWNLPYYSDIVANVLRLLVLSLPLNTILGLVSLYQIRRKAQRGKALAKWSSWSIGIMIILYILSSFIFACGDPAI